MADGEWRIADGYAPYVICYLPTTGTAVLRETCIFQRNEYNSGRS